MDPRAVRTRLATTADGIRAALLAEYGEVPERSRRIPVSGHGFPDSPDDLFPWAAVALVTDLAGERVLFVEHRDHDYGPEPPGGKGERGERPRETARRETREETGLDPEISDLLLVERVEFDYGDGPTAPVIQAVFAGRASGDPRVPDGEPEIRSARWFEAGSIPPDAQFRRLVRDRLLG